MTWTFLMFMKGTSFFWEGLDSEEEKGGALQLITNYTIPIFGACKYY